MIRLFTYMALLALLALSQDAFSQAHYSAFARSFLQRIPERQEQIAGGNALDLPDAVRNEFLVRRTESGDVVHGMIKVNKDSVDTRDLQRLGLRINSKIGSIWTVVIPVRSLRPLGQIPGIRYIDIDRRVKQKLDAARADTRVDLVNAGTDLPRAFSGNGVVVGVIDGGFDYVHPTFQNAGGTSRIARVWEQNASGTPPSSYTYGAEFVTPTEIAGLGESGSGSHGTHVAGIAAGAGTQTEGGKYKGVAHEAELVLVESGQGSSAVVDAVKYIFDYATAQSKPAVINMSLGSHVGPHDGTSLQDQAFDGLVAEGRILVGAAGNEGETPLHLSHDFGGSAETVKTILTFEDNGNQTGSGRIEMWGSPNTSFSVTLQVYDASFTKIFESQAMSSASDRTVQDSIDTGGGMVQYEAVAVASAPTNQRPNILMGIVNPTDLYVALAITAAGSTVHVWNDGKGSGASLLGVDGDASFLKGNTDYTVGEIGGTAAGVITVGAYTTKSVYTNADSKPVDNSATFGALAGFSSHGPTLDGRVKPDITAPGNVVISSVRAMDNSYDAGGKSREELVLDADNASTGRYASMQGTSMATPMVTGIVALMLEAKPNLSPTQIRTIFERTSRSDSHTGSIPSGGTNLWGKGKIDAFEAVKSLGAVTSIARVSDKASFSLGQNYPNPVSAGSSGNPVTSIRFSVSKSSAVSLSVFDLYGRRVSTLIEQTVQAGEHIVRFYAGSLPAGMYTYSLETADARLNRIMTVMK